MGENQNVQGTWYQTFMDENQKFKEHGVTFRSENLKFKEHAWCQTFIGENQKFKEHGVKHLWVKI